MKVTITLTAEEVAGLKKYLKEMDEPTDKEAIRDHIQNIVTGNLHSPQESISQYIEFQRNT